jgi:hypothetical protein
MNAVDRRARGASCDDVGGVVDEILSTYHSIDHRVARIVLITGDFHADVDLLAGDPLRPWACSTLSSIRMTCPQGVEEAAALLPCEGWESAE